jgi:repressor LexA
VNYTPKQLKIMNFIQEYRMARGTAPTLEEIGQSLGIHRVTVHQHIGALVKKGAVQKLAQRSRSIEILATSRARSASSARSRPATIEASRTPAFTLDELRRSTVERIARAGESMIEDHIADGGLVIVDRATRRATADRGGARKATLKRLYRGPGRAAAQPANASMSPILVRPPQRLEIRGVVRGVLRRY